MLFHGAPTEANGGLLTPNQFLAVHLSNHAAFVLAAEKHLEDAAFLLDEAVDLFPQYKAAWINKAIIALELGEGMVAEQCLGRAQSLKPGPRYQRVVDNLTERLQDGCCKGNRQSKLQQNPRLYSEGRTHC